MSKQRNLERERAQFAWERVEKIKDKADLLKEYASLAKSAPADIMSNGLGQTLAFWRAKSKDNKEKGHPKLLQHVTDWLTDERHRFNNKDREIINWIISLDDMNQYRRATSEAIAFLIWIKRFAEAEEKE